MTKAKTDNQVRQAVKAIFGGKNARVTRNGEVHVKGCMPNTNQYGWYFLGFTGYPELEEKVWRYDGSLRRDLVDRLIR